MILSGGALSTTPFSTDGPATIGTGLVFAVRESSGPQLVALDRRPFVPPPLS